MHPKFNHLRVSRRLKTRLQQLILTLIAGYGLSQARWPWVASGFAAYVFLETVAGNIGLHRYYGHGSFQTTPTWDKIFRFFCHYIAVGSVLSWVSQHRYHHKYSDTERDVHSPHHQGIAKICFGLWELQAERPMIRSYLKDTNLRWWHRNYFSFHVILLSGFLIIDLFNQTYFTFSLYALPCFLCLMSGYLLAILGHMHGYQSHSTGDRSTNSWLVNILTLGEGWHNNHHAAPERLRHGERRHEWDFPAWLVENLIAEKTAVARLVEHE